MRRRAVGQIFAAATLALMLVATMAVQLSVMQGMAQVQRESSGLQTVHDEKQSERLVLALAGGALNISNGGSIPS